MSLNAQRDYDVGLRRYLPKGGSARSFSSVGLIRALAERRAISAAERDRLLRQLVRWRFAAVPPSTALLARAVLEASGDDELRAVLALLSVSDLTLVQAAGVAARVIKSSAIADVVRRSPATVASALLDALAIGWPLR